MKKLLTIFIAMTLAFVVSACGKTDEKVSSKSEKITVEHELGKTDVPKNPKKVVVFDFGTLDSLDKLGIEVAGLPQDGVPSYLSKYEDKKYANVGGLKEPDFEKIAEIAPDLIIISGRQADLYKEFKEIAPTIYLGVDTNKYMESFKKNVTTIGQIFGKEKEVEKELTTVQTSIDELHSKLSTMDEKGLIVLANDGKVSAYGPKSRFGIIHDVFGLKAADEGIEVSTHGQSISFEYILEKNPDYLFVVDRGSVVGGESSAKKVVENAIVKKSNAYKNNHIVYLDPDYWYLSGGGLESVASMVNEISQAVK